MRWGRSSRGQDWKVPRNIRERVYVRLRKNPVQAAPTQNATRWCRGAALGKAAGPRLPGTGRGTHSVAFALHLPQEG